MDSNDGTCRILPRHRWEEAQNTAAVLQNNTCLGKTPSWTNCAVSLRGHQRGLVNRSCWINYTWRGKGISKLSHLSTSQIWRKLCWLGMTSISGRLLLAMAVASTRRGTGRASELTVLTTGTSWDGTGVSQPPPWLGHFCRHLWPERGDPGINKRDRSQGSEGRRMCSDSAWAKGPQTKMWAESICMQCSAV